MRLKKGDTVLIISGKDRGKRGTIEKVLPKERKILVTGVNLAKLHLKPSRKNPHGGIMNKIAPIDVSNAILVCPHCSKPSRVSYKLPVSPEASQDGTKKKKTRICRKCQEGLV